MEVEKSQHTVFSHHRMILNLVSFPMQEASPQGQKWRALNNFRNMFNFFDSRCKTGRKQNKNRGNFKQNQKHSVLSMSFQFLPDFPAEGLKKCQNRGSLKHRVVRLAFGLLSKAPCNRCHSKPTEIEKLEDTVSCSIYVPCASWRPHARIGFQIAF